MTVYERENGQYAICDKCGQIWLLKSLDYQGFPLPKKVYSIPADCEGVCSSLVDFDLPECC